MLEILNRLAFWRPPARREDLSPMLRVPAGYVHMPDGRGRMVLGFWLDARPVNNADWLLFAQATGAARPPWMYRPGWEAPEQPVVGITQREAEAFARWAGKRLPNEAQWQRAAGITTYPWGDRPADHTRAVFGRVPGKTGKASKVAAAAPEAGERPLGAGPFGHRDLVGNTWERLEGSIARGGFWGSPDPRCALRLVLGVEERSAGVGFRCVR